MTYIPHSFGMSNAGNTSGDTGVVSNRLVFAGGNNITLSQATNASGSATMTIIGGAGAGAFSGGISSNIGNTAGTTGMVGSQIVFAGGNNITLSQSVNAASATLTISAGNAGGDGYNSAQFTNSTANSTMPIVWAGNSGGSGNLTLGLTGSTVTGSGPAGGGGTAQAFAPYQLLTGSAVSSHVTNSYWFNYVQIPEDLAVSKVNVVKSFNYGLPGATSQASAGSNTWQLSHSLTVFKRSNYAANSSQLASVVNASMGMTFAHSHTSNQASLKVSFVTDSTGGTTSWSTASTGANHSSYWTGLKFVQIPLVTTLTAGEYWMAFAHKSSQTTNNSNYTQASVSNLYQGMQVSTVGGFGSNGSYAYIGLHGGVMGQGPASGTTGTMSLSAISATPQHYFYHNYQNLPVTTTP